MERSVVVGCSREVVVAGNNDNDNNNAITNGEGDDLPNRGKISNTMSNGTNLCKGIFCWISTKFQCSCAKRCRNKV